MNCFTENFYFRTVLGSLFLTNLFYGEKEEEGNEEKEDRKEEEATLIAPHSSLPRAAQQARHFLSPERTSSFERHVEINRRWLGELAQAHP